MTGGGSRWLRPGPLSTQNEDPPEDDKKPSVPRFSLSDRASNWVIFSVTGVWVLSNVMGVIAGMTGLSDYQPPEAIHGAFMLIVGTALMIRVKG